METDILILGAGVAGCAAAIRARQLGLTVKILERSRLPQRAPGETLHPGVEPLLKSLGVWEDFLLQGFLQHRGIWRESGGHRAFHSYGTDENGPWVGFHADRRVFGLMLQKQARAVGAELAYCCPREVVHNGARICGIVTEHGVENSNHVLDATGKKAWLANALSLAPEYFGSKQHICFGWRARPNAGGDYAPTFRGSSRGWEWRAPVQPDQEAWVKVEYNAGGVAYEPGWRIHRQCAGPGFLLVGDASGIMDPATGNGVVRAILSGIMAADSAHAAIMLDNLRALQHYRWWFNSVFDATFANSNPESS